MAQQSGEVAQALEDQGLDLPVRPRGEGIPQMPSDITAISDEALMNLWSELTAWQEYISAQVGCARIDERAAERSMERAQAATMVHGWTGKATERVAIAKAKFLSDPESQDVLDEHERAHAYRTLVETLAANVERNSVLISRELTRRTSDTNRNRKWGLTS
jgi:hypothetical protein